ncbi:MAG: hypothetical protein LBU32_02435 [Clostridiales bacterium]|jgi:hypothetical protein|nr:hypothetical protein [Clostridiales bacterium]
MSNGKEVHIAVSKDAASRALPDAAVLPANCEEKGGRLIYSGVAAVIPLFELSKANAAVRNYIVSEESLRATLCGNCPEYVKSRNMSAPPENRITDAAARRCICSCKNSSATPPMKHARKSRSFRRNAPTNPVLKEALLMMRRNWKGR